jgi:hypothetical protein
MRITISNKERNLNFIDQKASQMQIIAAMLILESNNFRITQAALIIYLSKTTVIIMLNLLTIKSLNILTKTGK